MRLSGGNVWDNSIAFKMDNPGNRISGQCNGTNIFLPPSVYRFATGILGNTTFLQVTGSADTNGGCGGSVSIDSWQPQQSNTSPPERSSSINFLRIGVRLHGKSQVENPAGAAGQMRFGPAENGGANRTRTPIDADKDAVSAAMVHPGTVERPEPI